MLNPNPVICGDFPLAPASGVTLSKGYDNLEMLGEKRSCPNFGGGKTHFQEVGKRVYIHIHIKANNACDFQARLQLLP